MTGKVQDLTAIHNFNTSFVYTFYSEFAGVRPICMDKRLDQSNFLNGEWQGGLMRRFGHGNKKYVPWVCNAGRVGLMVLTAVDGQSD